MNVVQGRLVQIDSSQLILVYWRFRMRKKATFVSRGIDICLILVI